MMEQGHGEEAPLGLMGGNSYPGASKACPVHQHSTPCAAHQRSLAGGCVGAATRRPGGGGSHRATASAPGAGSCGRVGACSGCSRCRAPHAHGGAGGQRLCRCGAASQTPTRCGGGGAGGSQRWRERPGRRWPGVGPTAQELAAGTQPAEAHPALAAPCRCDDNSHGPAVSAATPGGCCPSAAAGAVGGGTAAVAAARGGVRTCVLRHTRARRDWCGMVCDAVRGSLKDRREKALVGRCARATNGPCVALSRLPLRCSQRPLLIRSLSVAAQRCTTG